MIGAFKLFEPSIFHLQTFLIIAILVTVKRTILDPYMPVILRR